VQPVRNRSCLHFTIGVDYNHPLLAAKIWIISIFGRQTGL